MKILSPVDHSSEIEALLEEGAEEFYGGFLPAFWEEKYGHVASINRRSYRESNIPELEELERVVEVCWRGGAPFFLVLNAPLVLDEDIHQIVGFARTCIDMGVSGFIISDINLLSALRYEGIEEEIHCSTLFSAFSLATIRFLHQMGATRVVLPRELTLNEVGGMLEGGPGAKLEVIAMRGKCPNIEGYCSHIHDDPDRRWPCELNYKKRWEGQFDRLLKERVYDNISAWEGLDRFYSCGICAVPYLKGRGLHSVKLVGRGSERERKVKAVKMVNKIIRLCEKGEDLYKCISVGRSIFIEEFGTPCTERNCYFPEFFSGEGS